MGEQSVHNFGIASPKVTLLAAAPYITTNPVRSNFDVSADMFPLLNNSPYVSPLLAEPAIEADLGTFSVIYPSKRKRYINNFLVGDGVDKSALEAWKSSGSGVEPYITWTPTDYRSAKPEENMMAKYFKEFNQDFWNANNAKIEGYKGPVWSDGWLGNIPSPPNDSLTIKNFFEWAIGIAELDQTQEDSDAAKKKRFKIRGVEQRNVLDGLIWGIESSDFIVKEMPFWVNIQKKAVPVTQKNHPTSIIISLGLESKSDRYDLVLDLDGKPKLYDYSLTGGEPKYKVREWDIDLSRLLKEAEDIEIGFMTAGGRLIIHVNKVPMIYTRTEDDDGDNAGKVRVAKIDEGKIRVYGTNLQAVVNACPMTYAPLAMLAFPIPNKNQLSGKSEPIKWSGVKFDGEPGGTVAELPTPPNIKDQIYGVDCKSFKQGWGGSCSPVAPDGFHSNGNISFVDSGTTGFEALGGGFYLLAMQPAYGTMKSADGTTVGVRNMGCPYFFRLKGLSVIEEDANSPGAEDLTPYVISLSESVNAPDYFHVKKSATITLYNENGLANKILDKQYAVQISWGWNGENTDTSFTGVITSVQTSETPGMETMTLTCEDYIYILRSTPIINSPFYDGMLARYAIADLAKRAGCLSMMSSFSNEDEYFLASGFAYTKPQVKFDSKQMIFDCILDLAKRFEAYFYFDGEGRFTLKKLPGGLFSEASNFSASFSQDPSNAEQDEIILGEKNITTDYSSTVNVISILTLDRDTRNAIVYSKAASVTGQDILIFRKPLLIDQPAYGEIEVARKYAEELGERVFYPILKTNIKTVGGKFIQPLDFVKVLEQPFRVMAFKRNFSADNNDFSQDLECEWLGGKS